jgi:hypothetical protein
MFLKSKEAALKTLILSDFFDTLSKENQTDTIEMLAGLILGNTQSFANDPNDRYLVSLLYIVS